MELKADGASLERAAEVLRYQFDLEILLKRNELQTIKARLAQAEELAQGLHTVLAHYHGVEPPAEAAPSTEAVFRAVYTLLADGTFLRWACPRCGRSDFANASGFRAHCRQVHRILFRSLQETIRVCGVVVPESEVPAGHPCRTQPTVFLDAADAADHDQGILTADLVDGETEALRQDVLAALQAAREKPTIKVYDEPVAVDSDQSPRDSSRGSDDSAPPSPPARVLSTRRPSLASAAMASAAVSLLPRPEDPRGSDTDGDRDPTGRPPQGKRPRTAPLQDAPSAPASLSDATRPAPAVAGSRFYVQKRVVVGNSSRYIPTDRRGDDDDATHRWRVYVRAPAEDPDLAFVQKVRFFLHPSFAPHNLVEVSKPPFELRRSGWGEFPLRVQLFLVDPRRNKPVDIIHMLKLDQTLAGHEVVGAESIYNVEVDRASLAVPIPAAAPTASAADTAAPAGAAPSPIDSVPPASDAPPPAVPTEAANAGPGEGLLETDAAAPLAPAPTPPAASAGTAASAAPDTLPSWATLPWPDRLLAEAVHRFPVIGAGSAQLPYACAPSVQAFLLWDEARRRRLEVSRAKSLRKYFRRRLRALPSVPPTDPQSHFAGTAADQLSSRQIVAWCRAQGYTPQRMQPRSGVASLGGPSATAAAAGDDVPAALCRRCGSGQHQTGLCDVMTPLSWAVAATGLPGVSTTALAPLAGGSTPVGTPADAALVAAVAAVAEAAAHRPLKRRRLYEQELDSRSPAACAWSAATRPTASALLAFAERARWARGVPDPSSAENGDEDDVVDVDDSAGAPPPPPPPPPSAPSVTDVPGAPVAAPTSTAASATTWSAAQRAAAHCLLPLGASRAVPPAAAEVWPVSDAAALADLSADALELLWQSASRFVAALVRHSVLHVPVATASSSAVSAAPGRTQVALVPAHVWRAAVALPEADFLTQQYLAPKPS